MLFLLLMIDYYPGCRRSRWHGLRRRSGGINQNTFLRVWNCGIETNQRTCSLYWNTTVRLYSRSCWTNGTNCPRYSVIAWGTKLLVRIVIRSLYVLRGEDNLNLSEKEKSCYTLRTWTKNTVYCLVSWEFCLCSSVNFCKKIIKPYRIKIQKLCVALTDNFCKSTWRVLHVPASFKDFQRYFLKCFRCFRRWKVT